MAAEMKHNSSIASHECDGNAMECPAEKYQTDLQSAKPGHPRGGEALLSSRSESTTVSEFVKNAKGGRWKSTFTYILIAVGLLICLVWSATLFWFLARGLLRLMF